MLAPAAAAAAVAPVDTSGLLRGRRALPRFQPPIRTIQAPATAGDSAPPGEDTTLVDGPTKRSGFAGGRFSAPTLVGDLDSAVAFPILDTPGRPNSHFEPGASSDSTLPPSLAYPKPEPLLVMLRSALIPGWGQLTNGRLWKAFLAVGTEGYLVGRVVRSQGDLRDLEGQLTGATSFADSSRIQLDIETKRNERTGFVWWTATAVGVSMLDAYVDAHFRQFDVRPVARWSPRGSPAWLGIRLARRF